VSNGSDGCEGCRGHSKHAAEVVEGSQRRLRRSIIETHREAVVSNGGTSGEVANPDSVDSFSPHRTRSA
jgi:hypothetical protein